MSVQLSLPAGWARGLGMTSHEDPADQLRRLERDMVDAKAAIREVMDSVATRHDIRARDVNHAMDYVDDALTDMAYEVRGELTREIEQLDHLER